MPKRKREEQAPPTVVKMQKSENDGEKVSILNFEREVASAKDSPDSQSSRVTSGRALSQHPPSPPGTSGAGAQIHLSCYIPHDQERGRQ